MNTLTYNVRAFQTAASEDIPPPQQVIGDMARALAPYDLDVLCLQEASREAWIADLAEKMGMAYAYFPGGWRNEGWPEGISGAVLSRYPILDATPHPSIHWSERPEDLFTRFWGRAVLDTPDGPLAVHAAHLHHISPETRLREVGAILDTLDDGPTLVLGDLNHEPDSAERGHWLDAGMVDCFAAKGAGPALTWPADEPTMRIDYILARGPIADRLESFRVLAEAPFISQADALALSDHRPLFACFGSGDAKRDLV